MDVLLGPLPLTCRRLGVTGKDTLRAGDDPAVSFGQADSSEDEPVHKRSILF